MLSEEPRQAPVVAQEFCKKSLAVWVPSSYKTPSIWGESVSRLISLFFVLSLLSCTNNKPALNADVATRQGIMGGKLVAANSALAQGIVAIYDIKDRSVCTGSLIGEGLILTAAHCVQTKPANLRIVFGLDLDETVNAREPDIQAEYVRKVVALLPHEDYDQEANYNKKTDWSDIALIKFSGSIPDGYKPVEFLKDDSVLKRGTMVKVAGFGVTKVEYSPVDAKDVPNLDEAMEYGEVMCDDKNKNCLKIEMSGDGVLHETEAPVASVHETEVILDESKGHGTCAGDSGGPAFVESNGKFYLFGVTSRGSVMCDRVGIYTNAIQFKKWIVDGINKLK